MNYNKMRYNKMRYNNKMKYKLNNYLVEIKIKKQIKYKHLINKW